MEIVSCSRNPFSIFRGGRPTGRFCAAFAFSCGKGIRVHRTGSTCPDSRLNSDWANERGGLVYFTGPCPSVQEKTHQNCACSDEQRRGRSAGATITQALGMSSSSESLV